MTCAALFGMSAGISKLPDGSRSPGAVSPSADPSQSRADRPVEHVDDTITDVAKDIVERLTPLVAPKTCRRSA